MILFGEMFDGTKTPIEFQDLGQHEQVCTSQFSIGGASHLSRYRGPAEVKLRVASDVQFLRSLGFVRVAFPERDQPPLFDDRPAIIETFNRLAA